MTFRSTTNYYCIHGSIVPILPVTEIYFRDENQTVDDLVTMLDMR